MQLLTLAHHCLLQRGKELFGFDNRLQSYLAVCEHFVALVGQRSTAVKLSDGVPQGSVLEPFLFAIFTMPVGKLINNYDISYSQFADDTQLYTVIKSLVSSILVVISAL